MQHRRNVSIDRATGFQSPADDFLENSLSLDEYLIKKPASTFFMRAFGNSMEPTIKEKSLLVVDRSLVPRSHSLIVATLDGEFLVRRFFPNEKGLILLADNSKYRSLLIHPERDFEVWGVITSVIQKTV